MSSIVRIKRSSVAGNPATLAAGELAYSALVDNGSNGGDRLYIGMGTETVGNAANHVVIGGKYFTDMVTAATDAATVSTLVKRDASGNFSANVLSAVTLNVSGDTTITGNLTVNGTTTSVNSTVVTIVDKNITLASTAANAAAADGGGITLVGPTVSATLLYASADDSWNFNKKLNATAGIVATLTGNADTATKWATARDLSLTGDGTATLTSVDGSAAVSSALTLATVNSNVGSFGSSTSVASFTVNAKGLITAAASNAIPTATVSALGLASFATANFDVTAGAVSILAVDGGTY